VGHLRIRRKTSLVIKVTTQSGLGVTKPKGTVYSSYGSFGSVSGGFRLAFGGQNGETSSLPAD